jgi:hypothetical protein
MADAFELALNEEIKKDLLFRIRPRMKECNVPRCWELVDPTDDSLYLSRFETLDRKGRHVQLRRLLWYLEYGFCPRRRVITMNCENKNCYNPAHMRVKGWTPEYVDVMNQISRPNRILTLEQAQKWHQQAEA